MTSGQSLPIPIYDCFSIYMTGTTGLIKCVFTPSVVLNGDRVRVCCEYWCGEHSLGKFVLGLLMVSIVIILNLLTLALTGGGHGYRCGSGLLEWSGHVLHPSHYADTGNDDALIGRTDGWTGWVMGRCLFHTCFLYIYARPWDVQRSENTWMSFRNTPSMVCSFSFTTLISLFHPSFYLCKSTVDPLTLSILSQLPLTHSPSFSHPPLCSTTADSTGALHNLETLFPTCLPSGSNMLGSPSPIVWLCSPQTLPPTPTPAPLLPSTFHKIHVLLPLITHHPPAGGGFHITSIGLGIGTLEHREGSMGLKGWWRHQQDAQILTSSPSMTPHHDRNQSYCHMPGIN